MTSIPIWLPGSNTANFDSCADWDNIDGHVTTVGTNGGPSHYGTFDQSGNVWEWNDLDSTSVANRGVRGGSWLNTVSFLSSSHRGTYLPSTKFNVTGFRIASYNNPLNLLYFVQVLNPDNVSDSTGYGSVPYEYRIAQYPVTNCEYAAFLNAIGSTDTYGVYDVLLGDSRGGIIRNGSSGNYTYTIKNNMENKPVIFITWFNAARYCNWLHNGKPSGFQNNNTTENGAYALNGAINGIAIAKNFDANYHIPTENEWYKAAYFNGSSYWNYATQNNSAPSCINASNNGDGLADSTSYDCTLSVPTPTPTPTPSPTPIPCDRKIIKLYLPGTIIEPNGVRATNIKFKLKGDDPKCCGESNEVNVPIPPVPPPHPTSPPEKCVSEGLDLYGHTAIVSYDPAKCAAGHVCNRAIFDFYLDNYYIGQANLNNLGSEGGPQGGYRESVFTINEHIIISNSTTFEIRCALNDCHQGIGRLTIINPNNEVVFAACMPNDVVLLGANYICPTPTPSITPSITPTQTNTPSPTSQILDWRFVGSSYWSGYQNSINQTILSATVNNTFIESNVSLPTGQKYYGGTLLPDGKVFCVPYLVSRPLIYNPNTDTAVEATGLSGGSFSGGVLMRNGKVFMVPFSSQQARIYDPITNSVSAAGGTYVGSGAFSGGILMSDGRVFCVPRSSSTAIIYDPITDTTTIPNGDYGTDTVKFIGGVLLPDGRIFLTPYSSPVAKIYDPVTDSVFTSSSSYPSGTTKFLGSVLLPDGRVFSVPYGSTSARIYDPVSDTTFTPNVTYPGSAHFAGGVLLPNGKVFCVPRTATFARIYDPVTDSISDIPYNRVTNHSFTGGIVTFDGKVVCIPWESTKIFTYGGDTGFNINVSLSSYYNKL